MFPELSSIPARGAIGMLILASAARLACGQANIGTKEKVLYNFQNGSDGAGPLAGLTEDTAGNLYGTTASEQGCTNTCGSVFELSPPPEPTGAWTFTVLQSFTSGDNDSYPLGAHPSGGVVFDLAGNLYGTANAGGAYGWGIV
jgi:hypothetical protein